MTELDKKLQSIMKGLEFNIVQEFRDISHQCIPAAKEVITKRLTTDSPAYIVPIGDIHLGHLLCNKSLLKAVIEFIEKHRDVYTILLGDLSETATKQSVGLGLFDEEIHIQDQLDELTVLLSPLAQQGKIITMVTGNHEMRIRYMTGLDPARELARRLNIDYSGYQAYLNLQVGNQNYSVVVWHGSSGSITKAGKMKAAEKLKDNVFADIFISGHIHDRTYHDDFIDVIQGDKTVRHRRHYITCGSFLEYAKSYAEMKGYPIASAGTVLIKLDSEQKDVLVTY